MAQELATQASTAIACGTPFSTISLEAAIPQWLDRSLLSARDFYLPAKLPDGCSFELRRVGDLYRRAVDQPGASYDERTSTLAELRLRTMVREENSEEARARFRLLRQDLETIPLDVLREAVAAYAAENKFFPAGAGELMPFCSTIMARRRTVAWRMRKLAEEAEKREADERRRREDPLTPEEAAEIIERHMPGFHREIEGAKPKVFTEPRRMPTREDYIELGVDPAVLDAPE